MRKNPVIIGAAALTLVGGIGVGLLYNYRVGSLQNSPQNKSVTKNTINNNQPTVQPSDLEALLSYHAQKYPNYPADVPKELQGTIYSSTGNFNYYDLTKGTLLVVKSADWCIPCHAYKNQLKQYRDDNKDKTLEIIVFDGDTRNLNEVPHWISAHSTTNEFPETTIYHNDGTSVQQVASGLSSNINEVSTIIKRIYADQTAALSDVETDNKFVFTNQDALVILEAMHYKLPITAIRAGNDVGFAIDIPKDNPIVFSLTGSLYDESAQSKKRNELYERITDQADLASGSLVVFDATAAPLSELLRSLNGSQAMQETNSWWRSGTSPERIQRIGELIQEEGDVSARIIRDASTFYSGVGVDENIQKSALAFRDAYNTSQLDNYTDPTIKQFVQGYLNSSSTYTIALPDQTTLDNYVTTFSSQIGNNQTIQELKKQYDALQTIMNDKNIVLTTPGSTQQFDAGNGTDVVAITSGTKYDDITTAYDALTLLRTKHGDNTIKYSLVLVPTRVGTILPYAGSSDSAYKYTKPNIAGSATQLSLITDGKIKTLEGTPNPVLLFNPDDAEIFSSYLSAN